MKRALAVSLVVIAAAPVAAQAADRPLVATALERARAPAGQLERVRVIESLGVRLTRYRQEVGGLPVLDAGLIVTDAPGRTGDIVIDRSHRLQAPPVATLSREPAMAAARAYVGGGSLRAPVRAGLAVLAAGVPRIVWRVLLPTRTPFASFEVLVDARSAQVLRVRDLLRAVDYTATGRAFLFDPNPVVSQGGRGGLSDSGDANSAVLDGLHVNRTLPRLDADNASGCLSGRWAHARVGAAGEPALRGEVCSGTPRDWSAVRRADDRFEALMAYFHIDRTQAYIQSLGFSNVLNRPVEALANEIPNDNSYFDPATGQLAFGTGQVDDGEDDETIIHEYGHAVQDDQVPGFGTTGESLAIGEGFGDYLASAMSLVSLPGQQARFMPCFDEWDAFPFGGDPPCLRRLDRPDTLVQRRSACPEDLFLPGEAEVHCLGEVWSSALWAIRGAIGGAVTDRLVIQSHFSLTAGASFADASHALLAADAALFGRANRAVLEGELGRRGFVDPERLDDSPADARALAVPGSVSGALAAGADSHDVYAVRLTRGAPIVARLRSGAGNFDLRLLAPGAASVEVAPVAYAETPGGNEDLRYTPPADGTYFLVVRAISGAGPYTLEVAGDDRDGDGIADGQDRCPDNADPSQSDWDRDGLGDACDRSSRVSITRVRRRGRRLRVTVRMRPAALPPKALSLRISRRVCREARRCRYRRVRTLRARTATAGRVTLRLRLRPGRFRLRAVLAARGYERARSRFRTVVVRR